MGESLSIYDILKKNFDLKENDIKSYSPLILAYIGDAVYEIIIRTIVVSDGNTQVNKMHKKSSNLVKAETQANIIKAIMDDLSEEELGYYKRGRNAKSYTSAKNASISDYRMATGFEALIGYLYLTGQTDRMTEIVKLGLSKVQ
ncbi:MAG: ribonuclease III [Lachnospiraceae bacterium]|nr:ribonuclease III [Lachnospiraceae bacterium]